MVYHLDYLFLSLVCRGLLCFGTGRFYTYINWKPAVTMVPNLSSLVATEAVVTTASSATSDHKVGIMTPLDFQSMRFTNRILRVHRVWDIVYTQPDTKHMC